MRPRRATNSENRKPTRSSSPKKAKTPWKTTGLLCDNQVIIRATAKPMATDRPSPGRPESIGTKNNATAAEAIHRTGAVYDAEPPSEDRAREPGEWNEMEISFVGDRITVALNGAQVTDWVAEPRGKIGDFASSGYIGLQNHDWDTSVYFRNIRVKKLD